MIAILCRWFGLTKKRKWDWVEEVTGPPMLLQSVKAYNATIGLAHVKILEPGIIYPIDWRYTSQDWKNAGVLIGAYDTSHGAYGTYHAECITVTAPPFTEYSWLCMANKQ